MKWITLTPADLESALNKPQLDILKSSRLGLNGIDAEVIGLIVSRIRAEIAASEINFLDEDHSTIPPELKECAVRLAVEALQLRIPSMELSEAQKRHADYARQTLQRVAESKLPVCRPEHPISTGLSRKSAATLRSRSSSATDAGNV